MVRRKPEADLVDPDEVAALAALAAIGERATGRLPEGTRRELAALVGPEEADRLIEAERWNR